MRYRVDVSPKAQEQLVAKASEYTIMQDEALGNQFIDSFTAAKTSLESLPERGSPRLRYLPSMYRLIPFWAHLWLVYRVNKKEKVVYIDLVIDDRSDYGSLF
ncbi:type II toxin-antitoxin system RelE/ParE family toxin [Anaerovibrio sp.]|uniref:type II toxin-antitoxin system RelE/ParE family toxin n=1 Tax=Anaerovibrio sp. TaxID=1872532 RepID=UPI0025C2AA83|nr:type II toxin-antitoxin system RelE/ParE family toxin [Anaerovibrio sp.]MBR2141777.1 type II toxin-antitoxin system RelE/ParE family toxin [Anaerovibrio sp.]